MMPNSFLIAIGAPLHLSGQSPAYHTDDIQLYTRAINPSFIQTRVNSGFNLFMGECVQPAGSPAGSQPDQAGTRIGWSETKRVLTVECDRLGTATVYLKQNRHRVLLSNRKENLANAGDEMDWAAIQQYLHTGFTINSTTFFKSIRQTEPGTSLTIQPGCEPAISASQTSPATTSPDHRAEQLLDQIADQLMHKLSSAPPSVLMMSAGWDSRTLLLGGTQNLVGAYTHGDLSSREIELARKLTGRQRLHHLFVDLQRSPIDVVLIEQMLDELGFAVFPIWYLAARNVQQWKNTPIMSGVLGELLGGHYGLMSWGSRVHKLSASLLLLSDQLITESHIRSGIDSYCTPPASHWFVSDTGQAMLDENRARTGQRVREAIEQHHRNTGNWQRALEDFNMAHRARQYILKQAQAAAGSTGYSIPFADPVLADLTRCLPFPTRVHNRANQHLLKTRKPELLNESMAATLIPARYPILLQELSRAIRISRETLSRARGREKPRLGWFNYDHLYDGNLLHNLIDTLRADIWDRNRMHEAVNSNPANRIDAGSTLDMLCKIKTVDHYLHHSWTEKELSP